MSAFADSQQIENEVLHALAQFTGARVLEVGSGDGRMMRHYVRETECAYGVDFDFEELSLTWDDYLKGQRAHARLAQGRAEALPYAEASFDLVLLGWSLCCVAAASQTQALKEAWRVARSAILDIRAVVEPPQIWVRQADGREINCGPLVRRPDVHYNEEASAALAAALAAGWFILEAQREFEWLDVFNDVDELVGEVTEEWQSWIIEEDVALNLVRTASEAGRGAAPFVRQGVRAQFLRKSGPLRLV